ncbi:hypothetical protein [Achromobacter denitrificans]|uniref:hypothetical protein n=1 Tax=Achromobacter denitrificans TaxID=32002 RepID=UPI000B496153|nr:hypothetical protein [Achromobacter denitrificans]
MTQTSDDFKTSLSKRDVQRVLVRIEAEIERAREEGLPSRQDTPGWYALDRIAAIREVCDELLAGNRLACVKGYGRESEAEAAPFDKYLALGLHQTPDREP